MEVEKTADEGGESRVDRLGSGGASSVDLGEELLGLEAKGEEVEEVENLLLGGGGRSGIVRVAVYGRRGQFDFLLQTRKQNARSEVEERLFAFEQASNLGDSLSKGL